MRWKVVSLAVLLVFGLSSVARGQTSDLAEADRLEAQLVKLQEQGKYVEAIRLGEEVLAIREKTLGPEHPVTTITLNNLASMYNDIGDPIKALLLAQRALAIQEKAPGPEHPATAETLNNLANIYERQGNYEKALPLAQRALAIREKALGLEHSDTAVTLSTLAILHFYRGDYKEALSLHQRALAIREKALGPEHPATAETLNNLAEIYRTIGDYMRALPLYQRALAILEKTLGPEHPETAFSLSTLADLYTDIGDHEKALALQQQACAIYQKVLGFEHPKTLSALMSLAIEYGRRGDNEKAISTYQQILTATEKTLGPEHPQTASVLHNMAARYEVMGEIVQALPLFQRALTIREKTLGMEHPDTVFSVLGLAGTYHKAGDYQKALQLYERGLALEDILFANLFPVISEEQKLQLIQLTHWIYLSALSLVHRDFPSDPVVIRWGMELVLKRKGIVQDAQARTQQILTENLQGAALQSWQRLNQYRSDLSRLLLGSPEKRDPTGDKRTATELQDAIVQEEEFLMQHSNIAAQEFTRRQVTTQTLAARLPTDSALVEFVRIPDRAENGIRKWSRTSRYLAFVLTPSNHVTLIDLGDTGKIDSKVTETLAAINDQEFRKDLHVSTGRTNMRLAELYDLLLRPLETTLRPCRRLIVSPDGELYKAPFAALRTSDDHYLIEKMTVSYVASGRDLLRGAGGAGPTTDLLLVANPAFDDRVVFQKTAVSKNAVRAGDYGGEFAPLPGTAEEASIIPPLLQGTQKVLQGTEATESAIRSSKSPKVLHLATHGFFLKDEELPSSEPLLLDGGLGGGLERGKGGVKTIAALASNGHLPVQVNPMVRSGLALAGANHAKEVTTGDDGILTALEISGMNLYGTDLVVLSACETGLGDVHVGEGIYGLRRAFVLAGAKNLVMSLWAVNDKITLNQMAEFYRGYAKGKPPAAALREAQLKSIAALREQTQAALGEPLAPVRLWAPFIVQQTGESGSEEFPTPQEQAPVEPPPPRTTLPLETVSPDQPDGPLSPEAQSAANSPPISHVSLQPETGSKETSQTGIAGYSWWNLVVPLFATVGLLILSRVHLQVALAEAMSIVDPTMMEPQQSVPYARLVRQSLHDTLPEEIAFIHDDILIGSGSECDVVLRHPSIARQHARVQWRKQGYVLSDLRSLTGTYVNGRRVSENLLKDGWIIRLGEVEFIFSEAHPQT